MTRMMQYYVSRAVVTCVVVALLLVGGSPWWTVAAIGVVMLGLFLLMPRSGRYAVQAERGPRALRRDERGEALARLAARNGFIAVMVGLAAVGLSYGLFLDRAVPATVLALLVALGWAAYFVTDIWLRRG